MWWNLGLAMAIALATGTMAGLGGHLASTKTWHKWTFWGGGFLVWILIFTQTYRNEIAQRNLQSQLDHIQHNTETPPSVSVTVPTPTVTIPPSPPHTHVEYLSVAEANNALHNPPFVLQRGEPRIPIAFKNAGGFAVQQPLDCTLLVLVASQKVKTAFREMRKKMKCSEYVSGSIPAGSTEGGYHTAVGPRLTDDDIEKLKLGNLYLCGFGLVRWLDDTGKYETHFASCLEAEPDQSMNWHSPKENNEEIKRQ